MSVEIWNSYSNIDVSIDLINKANNITGLKSETQENLLDAKKQLTELKTKIDIANLVRQRTASHQLKQEQLQDHFNNQNQKMTIIRLLMACWYCCCNIGINCCWANSNKSSSSNDYPTTTQSYTNLQQHNDNSYSNDNSPHNRQLMNIHHL
jgi:hypothetical protein